MNNKLELKSFGNIKLTNNTQQQAEICMVIGYLLDQVLPKLIKEGNTSNQLAKVVRNTFKEYGISTISNFIIDNEKIKSDVHISHENVLCHGQPNDIPFKKGSFIRIDLVGFKNGVYGDSARTYVCDDNNDVYNEMIDLIDNNIFMDILTKISINNYFSDVSKIIGKYVSKSKFFTWKRLNSHAIDSRLHSDMLLNQHNEEIYRYIGNPQIQEQRILAIEPIISNFETNDKLISKDNDENIYIPDEVCQQPGFGAVHLEHAVLFTSEGNYLLDKHYIIK